MTTPRLTEQEIAELHNVLIWSRAHYAHHDPKGTAGANCPACLAGIRARELTDRLLAEREEMAKELREARELLLAVQSEVSISSPLEDRIRAYLARQAEPKQEPT